MTSDNKPYCDRHLNLLVEAKAVELRIAQRAAEERMVAELASGVSPYGTVGKMILTELLVFGRKTVLYLARALDMPPKAFKGYVEILGREGLIKHSCWKMKNGKLTYGIDLSPKGYDFIEQYLSD